VAPELRCRTRPAGSQHAEKMPVAEDERVAGDGSHSRNHAIGAGANCQCVLAARDRTVPHRPTRVASSDLGGGATLVFAVVPLDEVVDDRRDIDEPGESRRLERAPAWAREDLGERPRVERSTQTSRGLATGRREVDVGSRGVSSRTGPIRLAVPDDHQTGNVRHGSSARMNLMPDAVAEGGGANQRGLRADEVGTLVLLAAIWGASFLFIKVGDRAVGPLLVVTTRVVLGTVGLLVYLVARRGWAAVRTMVAPVRIRDAVFLSATGSTLPFLLIAWAETHISSSLAGILNATTPLFTAVLALAVGKGERPGWRIIGLFLGFAGATLVAGGDFAGSPLAIVAMIVAAPLYAASALHARARFADIEPIGVALVQVATSSVMLVPIAARFGRWHHAPGPSAIASLLLLSFGGTAFAYVLYYRLLGSAGPQHAIAVTYLVPIAAVAYGRVLLSERIRLSALVGAVIIIVGEAISASPRRPTGHVDAALAESVPP